MHHLRLVLIAAALCGATYGCATDDQPAASGAQSQASNNSGTYRTGSRLPSYDSDGSSSTGAQSKDDFMDAMNRGNSASGKRPGMAD
jgi:hypothetical protein